MSNKSMFQLIKIGSKTEIKEFATWDEYHDFRITNYVSYASGSYGSEAELRIGTKMLDDPCKFCGNHVVTTYYEPIKTQLRERCICFSCNFWYEIVQNKNNKKRVFINGSAYTIQPETEKGSRGFGGKQFTIKKFDEVEIIITTNLWSSGEIPEYFKNQLPDNAVLVTI